MSFRDDERKKIKVDAVMIFILDEKKNILLLKRIDNQKWEPVKGGVCESEGWREAALREMKEESDLNPIGDINLIRIVDDTILNAKGESLSIKGYVAYCFISGVKPIVELSKEEGDIDHDEYKWISYDEVSTMEIFPPIANDIIFKESGLFRGVCSE